MLDYRTLFVVATAIAALAAGGVGILALRLQIGRANRSHGSAATLGWVQFIVSGAAAAGIVALASGATLALGLGGFGLIHVLYLAIAFVPPLLGSAVLRYGARTRTGDGQPRRGARVPAVLSVFSGTLLLVPLVCAYATFVEPYRLIVERSDVPLTGLAPGDQPIRIVVLADIQTDHVGAHEHRAIDLALAEQPDLIVVPGDIFQGREPVFRHELPAMRALLARLKAPYGVFACIGNVDNPARTPELTAGTDVRMLFNEIVVVEIRGRRVAIGGVDWKCYSRRAQETFRAMAHTEADLRILLCHIPDGALVARASDRIDLLIAGHTHGGQVVVPGFGPLMVASDVPRRVAAGGLHRLNGQLLYVSRGVGFERGWAPPMRLFCRPEVSVLTLRAGSM